MSIEFVRSRKVVSQGKNGTFPTRLPPWNLFLLQQLGLVDLRQRKVPTKERKPYGGSGWLAGGARLTAWGTAVTWNLIEFKAALPGSGFPMDGDDPDLDSDWNSSEFRMEPADQRSEPPTTEAAASDKTAFEAEDLVIADEEDREPPPPSFGALQAMFQPYFPEWKRSFLPSEPNFEPGTHLYKVTLTGWRGRGGGIWRRLAVPTDVSLDILAGAILDAFNLDEDHLYDFRYRDRRGQSRAYYHPYSDEGPWTPEILVGETELPRHGTMQFLFDYGDRWEFTVRFEAVESSRDGLDAPKVIESAGAAPKPYPGAED